MPTYTAEELAAIRAELNTCTAQEGCTRPSLPGSLLCAEHVLAAHDAHVASFPHPSVTR